ncbi:hypothetical protein B0T17DRAFT_383963 [Bombardia bombarda]|uniref:Uncharacterized protein n=1 Tax=Bombardia bombarda TaxID=252184 RepID=A0AA39U5D2_9PEZI|nr:hypothetical protein B0T17DRAFT_383963 [Bombardia bombarda]
MSTTEPISLQSVKASDPEMASAPRAQIVDLFESAFNTKADAATSADEISERLATQLDALRVPPETLRDDEDEVDSIRWHVWSTLVASVQQIPADNHIQDRAVAILAGLARATSHTNWQNLEGLEICTRDAWQDPTRSFGQIANDDTYSAWVNLNAFMARLIAAGTVSWFELPIWEFRDALEESLDELSQRNKDTRLLVAVHWMRIAGKAVRDQALMGRDLDEAEARMLRGGELFAGKTGYTLERWEFWRQRFTEAKEQVSEPVRAAVDEALKHMVVVEGVIYR